MFVRFVDNFPSKEKHRESKEYGPYTNVSLDGESVLRVNAEQRELAWYNGDQWEVTPEDDEPFTYEDDEYDEAWHSYTDVRIYTK